MSEELLNDIKNYLDITYEDPATEEKIKGIIERGIAYIDNVAGKEQDYEEEAAPRELLFDYCRYARNNALEFFEQNFRSRLIALRMGVQADEYAAEV